MTEHAKLVKVAVRWLTGTQHCGVVLSEISTSAMEQPDAIGWQAHKSVAIECKVTRSDFLAQKNKPCIRAGRLVGNERYFLCPDEVIRFDDLAGSGYGLIWWDGKLCRIRAKAPFRALDLVELQDERSMLVSALRRIQTREFITILPPDTENA